METQFNVNVKVDIAIDNDTQQFVKDIVSSLVNRKSNPTTTVEIPQPEDKKPRRRSKEENAKREQAYNNIRSTIEETIQKAELISSEAGEQYHNRITEALAKYNADKLENLSAESYEAFYEDLKVIWDEATHVGKEKPQAEGEKPQAEEEKPQAEGEKPQAEEEKQPECTLDDIAKMLKSMQNKAAKLGDEVSDNLKKSLKTVLSKLGVKQVKELKGAYCDSFMHSLYTFDAQLDELADKVSPAEAEEQPTEEKISLNDLSELFRPVMTSHRAEIKDKLEELGAKNLAELAKDKYPEMKEFLISLK